MPPSRRLWARLPMQHRRSNNNGRRKLLSALRDADDFVSGEDLGKIIGASRAAVWKHIKQLRAEGIVIDSVQNRGYRYSQETDSLNPMLLSSEALDELDYDINYFLEIGSTNAKAQELARDGSPHGTVVLSEVQKTGKGRLSRQWLSPKGGLWMSVVLRPKISPTHAPFVTLMTGCALATALNDQLGVDARIKWPNDILIGGKKVCGILTEMDAEMQIINHIIIGMGMNVNNPLAKFPNGLRDTVTTLKEETGKKVDRPKLLLAILTSLNSNLKKMQIPKGRKEVLNSWKDLSDTLGRKVRVEMVDGSVEGIAIDVDEEGALLVEKAKGVIRVLSGDCVHLK